MRKCKICGKEKELRFDTCFNCVEAESIIATGLDMYDQGIEKTEIPAEKAIDKLKLLIQKGWTYNK